ncbi:hypothetical protein Tco_0060437, partial [Tanacetum coccineum]
MVDVASLSGTKIITSNSFDVFNMVENDTWVTPIDLVNSKDDDVNIENCKDINLDNDDNDKKNDVEEDNNETSLMASKSSKSTSFQKVK